MSILPPRYLAGRSSRVRNIRVQGIGRFGGPTAPKHSVKLCGLLLANRIRSHSALSNDTSAKAALRDFISSYFSEKRSVHGAHSCFFFLAFVGGALYYAWYKKNVLDKVSTVWIEAPDTDYRVDRTSFPRRLRPCIGISRACKGFIRKSAHDGCR
jgi:hypothetical protein